MLSPEDIANDAFKRIFTEVPNYENNEQIRLFFNQEREARTGHVCFKPFHDRRSGIRQQVTSRSEQCSPKRHKSPVSRHVPVHSPFSKQRLHRCESLNSVRKTKSTASPPTSKAPWKLRGITVSSPDLKLVDGKTGVGFNPRDDQKSYYNCVRENRVSRSLCYYNLELCNIILNCIILAMSVIYFACATAMACNKEIILTVLSFKVYILSIFSLYTIAIILLIISIGGLCFTYQSSRKTIAHAFFALLLALILVSLAFFQNSTELKIHLHAETQMLSTIQLKSVSRFKEIWDYFHETFKCCGVRGYLDWCIKEKFDSKKNITNGKEFLGSLVCAAPSSCCLYYKNDAKSNYSNRGRELCFQFPTPWNSHQIGCITPIKTEMYFLGKMYRIANFGLAIILLMSTITSVILFTQF